EAEPKHDLSLAVGGDGAAPDLVTFLDAGDVPQQQRHAAFGTHDDALEIFFALEQADAAHELRLPAAREHAAARALVVHLDGLDELRDGEPVLLERQRIDDDVDLT